MFTPSLWLVQQVNPLWIALFVLLGDFGVITILRSRGGRLSHMFYYVAGSPLGDALLLPLFAFGLAMIITSLPKGTEGSYSQTWCHIVALLVAIVLPVLQQWQSYKTGGVRWKFANLPEQWWHMIIFIVLLYFFLSLLPVIFVSQKPLWAFVLTVVCGSGFIACVVWDGFHDPIK